MRAVAAWRRGRLGWAGQFLPSLAASFPACKALHLGLLLFLGESASFKLALWFHPAPGWEPLCVQHPFSLPVIALDRAEGEQCPGQTFALGVGRRLRWSSGHEAEARGTLLPTAGTPLPCTSSDCGEKAGGWAEQRRACPLQKGLRGQGATGSGTAGRATLSSASSASSPTAGSSSSVGELTSFLGPGPSYHPQFLAL